MRQILDFLKRLFGLGEAEAAPKVRLRGKAPEGKEIPVGSGEGMAFPPGGGMPEGAEKGAPQAGGQQPGTAGGGPPGGELPGGAEPVGALPGGQAPEGTSLRQAGAGESLSHSSRRLERVGWTMEAEELLVLGGPPGDPARELSELLRVQRRMGSTVGDFGEEVL